MFQRILAVLWLALAWQAKAETDTAVRLAVIAEAPEVGGISDLLTAQLSANPRLTVLERGEINRIYHEQELSTGNRTYIQLGHLLGADGLIILEPHGKFLFSRLVAAKTGIVLESEHYAFPSEKVKDWVAGFTQHLQPLLPKLTVSAQDAIPISIVNLRAAFQNPEEHNLERDLTWLVREALSREPRIFVLERQALQLLGTEKEMAGDNSAFWNGSYLLDGIIDRDGFSTARSTLDAKLTPPQGTSPIRIDFSAPRGDPAMMAHELTRRILEQLKIHTGAPQWNSSDESAAYEAEAQWALRWGFFEAAQSASEAAWAMGRRSRQLMEVRVRAYADSTWPLNDSLNPNAPMEPDPAWIRPTARAMDLYCEETPLVWTNATQLDAAWFELGERLMTRASIVLNGFYEHLELRRQNESAVAELRDLGRRVLSKTDAQSRPVRQFLGKFVMGKAVPRGIQWDVSLFYANERYWNIRWGAGSLFFDTPEASLPMFEEMLKEMDIPATLPSPAAWSWEDRKRIPGLIQRFCDRFSASTNTEMHLIGCYFSVLRAPNDEFGSLETATAELMAELWKNRTLLYTNARMASLVPLTEKALKEKLGYYGPQFFSWIPFSSVQHDLRLDYLTNSHSVADNEAILLSLLPCNRDEYTKTDGGEFSSILRPFYSMHQSNRNVRLLLEELSHAAGTILVNVLPLDPRPLNHLSSMPGENVVTLKYMPWVLTAYPHDPDVQPKIRRLMRRNGKLWGMVSYVDKAGLIRSPWPASFVEINPLTGACRETVFPIELGKPTAGFEVTSNAIYVSLPGRLAWRPFNRGDWNTMPLQTGIPGELLALDNRVYFANQESVLEIDPETRAIKILASSRRYPSVNDLDQALGGRNGIYAAGAGRLGIYLTNRVFLFDLKKRTWNSVPLSEQSFPANATWFVSQDSAQLLSSRSRRNIAHRTLMQVSAGLDKPRLLLEQRAEGTNTDPADEPAFGSARWDWPQSFRLDIPSLEMENNTLWVLQARTLRWIFQKSEPIQFHDHRMATLLRFSAGSRRPSFIPLAFEKDGKVADPFALTMVSGENMLDPMVPIWLVTEKGIVITSTDRSPGHWLLPISKPPQVSQANAGGFEHAQPSFYHSTP